MTAPRWWQPRFEGTVPCDRVPPAFLEVLSSRVKRLGLAVVEERAEALPTYRDSAAPVRSLRIEHAEAFVGPWDRLRVWQEGGTLHYEGSFRRWSAHLLVTWLVFAGVYAAALTLCCTPAVAWGMGSWLFFWALPFYLRHRSRTRAWVERLVREELRALHAGETSAVPAKELGARGQ